MPRLTRAVGSIGPLIMPFEINCPSCQAVRVFPAEQVGHSITCTRCGTSFVASVILARRTEVSPPAPPVMDLEPDVDLEVVSPGAARPAPEIPMALFDENRPLLSSGSTDNWNADTFNSDRERDRERERETPRKSDSRWPLIAVLLGLLSLFGCCCGGVVGGGYYVFTQIIGQKQLVQVNPPPPGVVVPPQVANPLPPQLVRPGDAVNPWINGNGVPLGIRVARDVAITPPDLPATGQTITWPEGMIARTISPAANGRSLVAADLGTGKLAVLELATGQMRSITIPPGKASLAVSANAIFALDKAAGQITRYSLDDPSKSISIQTGRPGLIRHLAIGHGVVSPLVLVAKTVGKPFLRCLDGETLVRMTPGPNTGFAGFDRADDDFENAPIVPDFPQASLLNPNMSVPARFTASANGTMYTLTSTLR